MTTSQFRWNGLHVPFVAPWSEEKPLLCRLVKRIGPDGEEGIGYADEFSDADRRDGNLWVRWPLLRGRGKPCLADIHPLRQRQAMSHMLCMVCATSTFHNDEFRRWGGKHLFIGRAVDGRPIRDGDVTDTPPVCLPCAVEAAEACPHMVKGHTAALVERAEPWGVSGIVYDPRTLRPVPAKSRNGLTDVAFEDPALRWTLAARDVVTLRGCTPVDLADLATPSVAA